MRIESWVFRNAGEPMVLETRDQEIGPGEVAIRVAGCGVCHTDLGYYYDGVPTRHPLPLTLGHEIAGTVVETGEVAESWLGQEVIVPAVMPCGACAACKAGRGSVCPKQIFPGNDVHGGFGTHVIVPALGLCPVPDPAIHGLAIELPSLAVIADAVSTPYQAILRSGLKAGDLAVFIGVGGVGGYGVQIAAARGAHVIAIDVDPQKLALISEHGATCTLRADELEFKELKKAVKAFAAEHEIPTWRWRVFETSGTRPGQETAFSLLGHGSHLSVVGFTPEKVNVRLSNLMAFDADVQGNWGCLPEHYPAVLELVLNGKVKLGPFVEHRPLATINDTFASVQAHVVQKRVVLIPEA